MNLLRSIFFIPKLQTNIIFNPILRCYLSKNNKRHGTWYIFVVRAPKHNISPNIDIEPYNS